MTPDEFIESALWLYDRINRSVLETLEGPPIGWRSLIEATQAQEMHGAIPDALRVFENDVAEYRRQEDERKLAPKPKRTVATPSRFVQVYPPKTMPIKAPFMK